MIVGEFIQRNLENWQWDSQQQEHEFMDMFYLYTCNPLMLTAFADSLKTAKLTRLGILKSELTLEQFLDLMSQHNFLFVNCSELRKAFTDFIYSNEV